MAQHRQVLHNWTAGPTLQNFQFPLPVHTSSLDTMANCNYHNNMCHRRVIVLLQLSLRGNTDCRTCNVSARNTIKTGNAQ